MYGEIQCERRGRRPCICIYRYAHCVYARKYIREREKRKKKKSRLYERRGGGEAAAISGSVNAFFNQPAFGGWRVGSDQSPKTPPSGESENKAKGDGRTDGRRKRGGIRTEKMNERETSTLYSFTHTRATYTFASRVRMASFFLPRDFLTPRLATTGLPRKKGFVFFALPEV